MKVNIQTPIERLIAIWKETASMDAFLSNLSKIGQVDPHTFCSLVFLSSENSIASLNKRLILSSGFKVEEEKPNSALYYLNTFVGKEHEKIEGKVILFQEKPCIYFMFTVANRDFIDRCLLRFLVRSYPTVFQPVLKQNNLKEILTKIESQLSPNTIRVTKSSSKRWAVSEGLAGRGKRICSRLDWENASIKDAFKEAAEEGKWFTKLTFKIYVRKGRSFTDTNYEGTISKRGVFLTNRWSNQYSEIIIPFLLLIAEEKISIYKNRSRAESKSQEIRPLIIKFGESVFENKKNSEEFIAILKKIPHFGYSVMHANPYIHMSLLDYRDGSSFEILVHEPDKALILPQIRTSSIALERIIGYINEKFSEGEVVDLKDIQ